MAKTLLNGVNDVLRRAKGLQGEAGELSSLTDSARQVEIDEIVNQWNIGISTLFDLPNEPVINEAATASLTFVDGTREYTTPSDLLLIRWPLINTTDGQTIYEYPGGFDQMRIDQLIPSNYTGLAQFAVIEPILGKIRLDTTPTSVEAGNVYTITYDKSLIMAVAADIMPFDDNVYQAMTSVVLQLYTRERRGRFDGAVFRSSLSLATRLAQKLSRPTRWGPVRTAQNTTDPMNAS